MSQTVEAGHNQQQFIEYSLDNLRALSTNGHLPPPTNETRDHVNTIVQSYFESSLYREFIGDFTKAAETIEPNRSKIETSFKEGLIKNLRAVNYYSGEIKNKNILEISRIIQGFTLHCNKTLENIIDIPQANKCLPAFHSTIQSPHLLDSDLLKQLLLQISDNSYLSYLSINQLFTNSTKNIKTVIVQTTKSFEKLKTYNQEHQLGLSNSAMRLLVTCYANPFDHIVKQAIPIAEVTKPKRPYHKHPRLEDQSTETKPKRPYHRHIIPNVIDKNPTQKTVTQGQPQTTEITSRVKRPYHRRPKPEDLPNQTLTTKLDSPPLSNTEFLVRIKTAVMNGRISLEERQRLLPIISELNILLKPIEIRQPTEKQPNPSTVPEKEKIVEQYLRLNHEFLTKPIIEYYYNRYHNCAPEIEEGRRLYDSLKQRYIDIKTYGIQSVIVESIKRRRQDAYLSINKYISIMSDPIITKHFENTSPDKILGIINRFIYEKNVNISELIKALDIEAKQWG